MLFSSTSMTDAYVKTLLYKSKTFNYFSKLKLHSFLSYDPSHKKGITPVF